MFWFQTQITLKSRNKGCYLITEDILKAAGSEIKKISIGMCNIFLPHTSAGLCLNENCDPTVRQDMKTAFDRLVPQGKGLYNHDAEGPDDMPAHIKSTLSGASLNIPISKGTLALGIWQGVWLMEYRSSQHSRKLLVTLQGQTF